MEVLIIGAGIGGLTLGLMLHRAGIACRIFEAAPELKAVGVGINILPHASRELCALGLEDALAKVAVTTREYCFYNRFGQFIYSEPAGRFAGYDVPQFSIHRGDLQIVLLDAFVGCAGADKVIHDMTPYVLENAWYIPTPETYQYNFWWPWLKNYHGEANSAFLQYFWIDKNLKKSMGH